MLSEIINNYLKSRPNRDQIHPKIAVFFLACSGSGKSTITKLIVRELGATYLRNDDVRQLLHEYSIEESPRDIINTTWKRMRSEFLNQFIVFDSNMSSSYMHPESYFNVAKREGYRTFIILLDLSEEELTKQVINRNRYDTAEILKLLPGQLLAQRKAKQELESDFTMKINANSQDLIRALRQFEKFEL